MEKKKITPNRILSKTPAIRRLEKKIHNLADQINVLRRTLSNINNESELMNARLNNLDGIFFKIKNIIYFGNMNKMIEFHLEDWLNQVKDNLANKFVEMNPTEKAELDDLVKYNSNLRQPELDKLMNENIMLKKFNDNFKDQIVKLQKEIKELKKGEKNE